MLKPYIVVYSNDGKTYSKVGTSIYNYAEVTVRRAELHEVDIVKQIIKEAYATVRKQLSRQPGALKEGLDKIARSIQMGTQYVALVGDHVVGVMRVSLRGTTGVISRVAVRPKFRGRRIGTTLVEYGENLLVHMNAQFIDIDVYNAIAEQQSFYEQLGYEVVEKTKREGEEIIVMRKSLADEEVIEEDDY